MLQGVGFDRRTGKSLDLLITNLTSYQPYRGTANGIKRSQTTTVHYPIPCTSTRRSC